MASLPNYLQPLLTGLTGKALSNEKPWFRWSRSARLVAASATFLTGVTFAATAFNWGHAWLTLIPLGWLFTASAVRVFQVSIIHHASHGNLFTSMWVNRFVAEALSVLVWIQPLSGYQAEHGKHHAQTSSKNDPDLQFLVAVGGMRPGWTMKAYWLHFWLTMISPRFHAEFIWVRLRAGLITAPLLRRSVAWGWAAVLLNFGVLSGHGSILLVAFAIPVTLITQISAWVGLLGLHQWVRRDDGTRTKAEVLADVTSARYVGIAPPAVSFGTIRAAARWVSWTIQMLTKVLATRLFVIPGDLPSHDWHHFVPKGDWPNHAYSRAAHLMFNADHRTKATEFWGIGHAIEATFRRLSDLDPKTQLVNPLTPAERRGVFLGM